MKANIPTTQESTNYVRFIKFSMAKGGRYASRFIRKTTTNMFVVFTDDVPRRSRPTLLYINIFIGIKP